MSQEAVVNKRIQVTGKRSKLRTMVQIAMLSAVSAVLMMFEFPIPFLAPPFIKMDFSDAACGRSVGNKMKNVF